jgi:hypothetical protein
MVRQPVHSLILLAALFGAAGAFAQQPTEATTAAPTPAPAPQPVKPTGPSADTLKKAKLDGYKAKLRKGQTLFCKEQVELGSHFSTETCIDENQLLIVMDREQAARDTMTNHSCGNGACGGK